VDIGNIYLSVEVSVDIENMYSFVEVSVDIENIFYKNWLRFLRKAWA
jgi:hypothetical protein